MKLLILTTQTTHHAKFVQSMKASVLNVKAIIEKRNLVAPFDVSHDYLVQQNAYERKIWFDGEDIKITDLVDTLEVENINDAATLNFIKDFSPDLVVVFGTGKILPKIINLVSGRIVNLHGGDPEQYRGLDTHLWAVYHSEFNQLITCLHEVAPDLDAGDIVGKAQIKLTQNMELYQLRAQNTNCCIELILNAVSSFEEQGKLIYVQQVKKGRYYSFMPTVLKDICVKKFRKHNI